MCVYNSGACGTAASSQLELFQSTPATYETTPITDFYNVVKLLVFNGLPTGYGSLKGK